jgi:tetratricopeptide (TPR) repeat protein
MWLTRSCSLAFLLLCCASRSAAVDWERVHALTTEGIQRLYNLEIDEAIVAFDSVSRIAPADPRGPFFQSIVHFYLYGLNREEKELNAFLEESEHVIEICDRLLDQNENDATTKFYLGGIHGYRGLAHHTNGSYLKAAHDGRKGYLLLEEAISINPQMYDAQMGFGLFRYLLAKLPKSMRWILGALGFSGDLEGGLRSLRLAAEKGTYTRTEAKLFLAQFMFAEGKRDTALQLLNELRRQYPENTLFLVLYSFWQHRLDNLDEAMTAARAAIELNNRKQIKYGEELAYSTLGSIYFTKNDFANAAANYRLYMTMTRNDERTPNRTFFRAALAMEIVGDRTTAVVLYKKIREVDNPDRLWDARHYRRVRELLTRPLSESEILIVKAENESSLGKFAASSALYDEAFRKTNNVELHARALYGMQQAQYDEKRYAESVETAKRLVALRPVGEAWAIPHGWYRLGLTYEKLGRVADARNAFERVRQYDDYDMQERLEERTAEELARLAGK